jgi:4-alpha-glucanotransferase
MFLQFLAERQLAHAQKAARSAGMAIGVVRDLALGIDPDGADAWMGHDTFVRGLRCGAPRDAFHPQGQEWGVLPFNPIKLRTDHAPFVSVLRANMRHAGGLRIDHIIGVERQFLVPVGEPATLGCYLRFPREQLVALIALESRRNQCMVIGEDLGTVPEGLRQRMHDAQMFGCSILPFERGHAGEFRAPDAYRTGSLAAAGTHDLPTICGYWKGADIALRERLGLLDAQASAAAAAERLSDKKALLEALARKTGLLRAGVEPAAEDVRRAIHAFLASSAASLFAAQLDDLLDEAEQLNVPGTVDAYPNWRRKLSVGLEDPKLKDALEELAQIARHFGRA